MCGFQAGGRLREARAFNELREYHTRPSRFNWDTEKPKNDQIVIPTWRRSYIRTNIRAIKQKKTLGGLGDGHFQKIGRCKKPFFFVFTKILDT